MVDMVCKTIIGGSIPPRASKIFFSHFFLMPMEDMLPNSRPPPHEHQDHRHKQPQLAASLQNAPVI